MIPYNLQDYLGESRRILIHITLSLTCWILSASEKPVRLKLLLYDFSNVEEHPNAAHQVVLV